MYFCILPKKLQKAIMSFPETQTGSSSSSRKFNVVQFVLLFIGNCTTAIAIATQTEVG
jgi:hypothetical protein